MEFLYEGATEALRLIITLDPEIMQVVARSLAISCSAVLLSCVVSLPAGFLIGTGKFRGRNLVEAVLATLLSLPTVVIGLLVYSFISRRGLLGPLGLLYTPYAMVIGQVILASPIIAALTASAVKGIDRQVRETALTLGANRIQTVLAVFWEARFVLLTAVVAGFGRVIAEVGSAMMIGGNIRGYTRVMTTALYLETTRGEFGNALALGIILLMVALSVNIFLHAMQRKVPGV